MATRDKPRLLLDALVLGITGGLSAQVFTWLLRLSFKTFLTGLAGYIPPGLSEDGGVLRQVVGHHGLWLIPVSTTLGGLISGAIVYGLAPEAEGHGTDAVVKALHWTGGTIRARVPAVKMIASAITIGSGGSAGREGPTALIAAGVGSVYASVLKRPEREKRLLVVMGMAAGLAAIFRSPIGTAIFAVEVLYSSIEFESEALLYCMLAAIVAYAVNGTFVGWQPLFHVPLQMPPMRLVNYAWYSALGIASGVVAAALPEVFYRLRDAFLALRVPAWIKPGIGGCVVGLIALKLPQVLGGGYGWIQQAIDGQLALHLLLILMIAKIAALAFTVSSGGSGGVFAPSLYVGAMLGGAFASILHHPAAPMVIIGMGAVFGGAARVPVATFLMVAEMTGGYQLLVPAGLAVMLSYLVQMNLSRFLKYSSLYEAQVEGRSDSPSHRTEQVQTAMRLLEQGNVSLPADLNHLHLATLLQSGVALDLPDGFQLTAGVLRPQSSWVGKSIRSRPASEAVADSKIVAVLRGSSLLLARPDTILKPGDHVLLVIGPHAEKELAEHLARDPKQIKHEPMQ